jgi:DNA-binding beta-propeller fold protein YncE
MRFLIGLFIFIGLGCECGKGVPSGRKDAAKDIEMDEGKLSERGGTTKDGALKDGGRAEASLKCDEPKEGCPCIGVEEIGCYEGDPKELQVKGECKAGKRRCLGGLWGPCEGQVLSRPEFCDQKDNDCDGEIDEGVISPCGDCDITCNIEEDKLGSFDPEAFNGVVEDPDRGGLVISSHNISAGFAWIAHSVEDEVSKIDLDTGQVVGRYKVGRSEYYRKGEWRGGNSPSRTAVDGFGNAYVANRGFRVQGSVTKIAGDRYFCVDRNHSGSIETSTGKDDVLDYGEDECIIWTVDVGERDAVLRAITIDQGDLNAIEGYIWVGGYNSKKFYKLDPKDGHTILERDVPLRPYGAALAPDGTLWTTEIGNGDLVSINTRTAEVGPRIRRPDVCGGRQSYGITVDAQGRVWTGGWGAGGAYSYNPQTQTWSYICLSGRDRTRGIAVDNEGRVWVVHYTHPGKMSHFLASLADEGGLIPDSNANLISFPSGSNGPIGVGVDFQGRIWAVNRDSRNVIRYDPQTDEIIAIDIGARGYLYTYSDFTGFQRQNVVGPEGKYSRIYDGNCYIEPPLWEELEWDAITPENTQIKFVAYTSDIFEEIQGPEGKAVLISTAPDDLSPASIDQVFKENNILPKRYLKIEARLISLDREKTPVLRSMSVKWRCP